MKKSAGSKILFTVTLFFWFSQYAYTSYVNPELERLGASAVLMGFVGSVYGLAQLVLRIPVGVFADTWKKKFFVCAGCLCASLASLCMLLGYHPLAFFIGRALGGVGAATWVVFTVLYSDYFLPEESIKSITTLNVSNMLGRLLSFALAGVLVSFLSPKISFLIAAIGGFIAFFLSLFICEPKKKPGQKPLRAVELVDVAKDRNLLVTSGLALLAQLVGFATYFSFTSNYAVLIGASEAQLSYINVLMVLSSVVVNFVVSKYLLKYVAAQWLVIVGFIAITFYCAFLPFVQTVLGLYAMQLVAGAGNMLSVAVLMGLCVRDIVPEKRSAAMGFFQAVYGVGMTLGPLVMGTLVNRFDLRSGFFVIAAVSVANTIVCVVLLCAKKPRKTTE